MSFISISHNSKSRPLKSMTLMGAWSPFQASEAAAGNKHCVWNRKSVKTLPDDDTAHGSFFSFTLLLPYKYSMCCWFFICVNKLGKSERRHKWNFQRAVFVTATCQFSSPGAKRLWLHETMSWGRHIDSSEPNEMMFRVMDRQGDGGQLAPSHRDERLAAADRYSRNALQHPHLVSMATKWTGIPFPDQVHFQSRPASLLKMKGVCEYVREWQRGQSIQIL